MRTDVAAIRPSLHGERSLNLTCEKKLILRVSLEAWTFSRQKYVCAGADQQIGFHVAFPFHADDTAGLA